jgi:apolipoprotein N-acyltransferase
VSRFVWPLYALVGGVFWGLCFSAEGFQWAAWIALAPLFLLLGQPRPLLSGFLFIGSSWLVAIPWIAGTLVNFGSLSNWLAWPLLAALCAYLGLYGLAFAWLARRLWQRGPDWTLLLGAPAIWVMLEWVRTWMISGFPWNLAGYAWIEVPGALEASAWIGAYGVSFLVVLANLGVALALDRRRRWPAAWAILLPILALTLADRWEQRVEPELTGVVLDARVLQPDIANLSVWDAQAVRSNYSRLIAQSHQACDRGGALIVWPEGAAWPYELGRDPQLAADLATLNAKGCSVLLGSPRREGDKVFNSAVVVSSEGESWYDKRHLVPWGEYVPLSGLLAFVDTMARNAGDFERGSEVRLLRAGGQDLGGAICYEAVFPREVAETVIAGATVLVSITNDDWYGPSSARWQHLRAARFRSAESRRTMLRAAVTGVSAVIAPDGSLTDSAGPAEQRTLSARIRGRRDLTFYVRHGGLAPWLLSMLSAFAIIWSRRTSESSPSRSPEHGSQ